MKLLFVGLGSIACRHIRNLADMYGDDLSITVARSGLGGEIPSDLEDKINRSISVDEKPDTSFDAVFITGPTSCHYDSLKRYLNCSGNFFIEKPVFVTGEEELEPFGSSDKVFYVACPLRYSNVICWLRENLCDSRIYAARVISSSYLPDWRPGKDYRLSYSARKDLGGGVSVDLIHEWDYICHLFGFPETVKSFMGRKSKLEIDSEDIALYIADYADKTVEIHLDYFGRAPIRQIELFMEDDTVVADLINQRIRWIRSGRELDLSEDRDAYQKKELMHFFEIAEGKMENDNDLEKACRVLRIARGLK